MVLHELATNAVKYGALSTRRGHLDIIWQLAGGVDRSVELVWQERDGPAVNASASAGFGTKLINRVSSHDLDGKTEINFDSAGVRCTIAFPLGDIANRRPTASDSATA